MRRTDQLECLKLACARRAGARVSPRDATSTCQTRFLTLHRDAVLLEWPARPPRPEHVWNTAVDIFFEADGEHLACHTTTRGQVLTSVGRRTRPAWRLGLPLRVEARQQRRSARVPLEGECRIEVALQDVLAPERTITGYLTDLSVDGLGGIVELDSGVTLEPDDVFCAELTLPGHAHPLQFLAQLVHQHSGPRDRAVRIGCRFCPTADAASFAEQQRVLEEFTAQRGETRLKRRGGRPAEGW